MQEFDPRRPSARVTPRLLVVLAGLTALGVGWKLTADSGPDQAVAAAMDPAAMTALQHDAFAQAETQAGFARGVNLPMEVRPGETLEAAVRRSGIGAEEASHVVGLMSQAIDTVNVKAGMDFVASVARPSDRAGPARLIGLSMRTGPATALTVSRTFDGALHLREFEEKVSAQTTAACGEMHGSLYESASRVGATPGIVNEASKLFSHKIDFSRDIKAGDPFCLVFDRKVTDSGRTVETGDLQYAEVKGQRFYNFVRADGKSMFFDEFGKNIKGFLLRYPVDGARITSGFGSRRHPVLGYTRMHQGTDFGVGVGTPVLAAADGVVVETRRWAGYGNWVRVRHSGGWETGYAHLSRFAVKPGTAVSQGQVIAYSGNTGLSTGPHLHYEVWFNGNRINPVGAKVPSGTVLAGGELTAFKVQKARIDALLKDQGHAPGLAERARTQKVAIAEVDTVQAGLRPPAR